MKYPLSFLLFFLSAHVFGQKTIKTDHSQTDWYLEMMAETPNVLSVENAFRDYFKQHPLETSHEQRQCRRWLEAARLSMDENGVYVPFKAVPPSPKAASRNNGDWKAIGPNEAYPSQCNTSSNLSGGFCDRVYINPYNTQHLFAGMSYGGLYVSHDQGDTWTLTDAEFANGTNTYANRDYYYGEIEAHKLEPLLVYAATESGLLKSENGGLNWTLCPELNRYDNADTRPYFVAQSLDNQQNILVTFGRKVFKSTDAGQTWAVVFDNTAGGPNHKFTNQHTNNSNYGINERTYNFFGLESDASDPNVFFLGVWEQGNLPAIYKSTNGGNSFEFLTAIEQNLGRTMPKNLLLKTLLSESGKFYLYSQFVADSIYTFDENATLLQRKPLNASTVTFGTAVDNIEHLAINEMNENELYAGFYFASSIMKSTNGGVNFSDQTSGYSGCPKYVHPDVRSISVVGDLVLIGSDGGVAISKDGMNTVNSNIGREISSVDLWGFSSSPKGDFLSAGCDHGPTKYRFYDGDEGWYSFGGGDASHTSINQAHDQWVYYQQSPGAPVRATYIFTPNSHFLQHQGSLSTGANIDDLAFHPNLWKTSYPFEGSKLLISEDNLKSLQDLFSFQSNINQVKIAPHAPQTLFVLHGSNQLKKSTDGGATWASITPPMSVTLGASNISAIETGATGLEIWVAYGGFQNTTKVVKSSDGGVSWQNITGPGLPEAPVQDLVHQLGTDGGIYIGFAGKHGVFYLNNSLNDWIQLSGVLPSIGYIRNMFSVPMKGVLRMGSSRGAHEHELFEESAPLANFSMDANTIDCGSKIEFVANPVAAPGGIQLQWNFPTGIPSSSTSPKVTVEFPSAGVFEISLIITDKNGLQHIKTLPITVLDQGNGNCLPVSTKDLFSAEVRFFPNPNVDYVQIELSETINDLHVALFDEQGRTILQDHYEQAETIRLDVSDVPQGVYFVHLQDERGVLVSRLVKGK